MMAWLWLGLAQAMAWRGKCLLKLNQNIIRSYCKSYLQHELMTTTHNKNFNMYLLMLAQWKMYLSWSIEVACLYLSIGLRLIRHAPYCKPETVLKATSTPIDPIKSVLCIIVYPMWYISLLKDSCVGITTSLPVWTWSCTQGWSSGDCVVQRCNETWTSLRMSKCGNTIQKRSPRWKYSF
jgi:hypothetical protein